MTRLGPILLLAVCSLATSAGAGPKPKAASLKQLEQNPDGYLGRRVVVEAWVGPDVKAAEPMAELTVLPDAKGKPGRLRFLAAKSLAEQLSATREAKPALLTGTVSAPESNRAGYSFEVEEISLPKADGTATVLKPSATVQPVEPTPAPVEKAEPAAPPAKSKPVEGGKKSDKLQDLLMLIAGGLALFMVVSLVVGVRLLKHLKKQPAVKHS